MAYFTSKMMFLAKVGLVGGMGYAGYVYKDHRDRAAQEKEMYTYTTEELLELGEKVFNDFQTKGYSQIAINNLLGMRIRGTYWGYRHFFEFSAERLNLTETVYDRLSCYHLEAPKDGEPHPDYDPWHYTGGPGPKPTQRFTDQVNQMHRDMTFVGDKVMAGLAAVMKNNTLAAIAVDDKKRSEIIFKYYPEETPHRPATCGKHGLFYILPSTTHFDSPLCPKTFEVWDPKNKKYINLEDNAPDIVCLTIVPGIPLLRYTRKFKPTAWKVASEPEFTHDGRKTIEYAYGTHVNVPIRGELRPEDQQYFGIMDNFKRKKDPLKK